MYATVTEIGKTQKGTPKLKLNGTWVFAGNLTIDGIVVGRDIEYWVKPFKMANGKSIDMLEAWLPSKPLPVASTPTDVPPVVPQGSREIPANYALGNGAESIPEAEMRYISNEIAALITANVIKAPADIRTWVLALRASLKPADEFETEIP